MTARTRVYWIATALATVAFAAGGVMDLIGGDDIVAQLAAVGYPAHLATVLGVWKLLGAIAIAAPGLPRFVSAQVFYTIASRDIERELVPLCQAEGLGILPWSPLAGGLLTGKFTDGAAGPAGARRTAFDFPLVDKPRAFACVEAMRPIAAAHGVSIAQIALAYLLHKPAVTSVIIGARTDAQLADNLAAAKVRLATDELAALDQVSALPPEYPGWMTTFQERDRFLDGMDR